MSEDADISLAQLRNIRSTVRPLLFSTGISATPISTWGTCFLIGKNRRVFVVTANHLVGDIRSTDVVVQPFDGSSNRLRLRNGFRWQTDEAGEYDVIVYEVGLSALPKSDFKHSRILCVDDFSSYNWRPLAFTTQFLLMGHPAELNYVDYDASLVKTKQILFPGRYLGPSEGQDTIHRIEVVNPLNIEHFRGMSGAPVVAVEIRLGAAPATRFCGIAITGTRESGTVHFLEASVIASLLDDACAYWDGDHRSQDRPSEIRYPKVQRVELKRIRTPSVSPVPL